MEGDSFADELPVCPGWKYDHSSRKVRDAPENKTGEHGTISTDKASDKTEYTEYTGVEYECIIS